MIIQVHVRNPKTLLISPRFCDFPLYGSAAIAILLQALLNIILRPRTAIRPVAFRGRITPFCGFIGHICGSPQHRICTLTPTCFASDPVFPFGMHHFLLDGIDDSHSNH